MSLERPEVFRQSLLQGFTTCARRTKHALIAGDDMTTGFVGHSGDLGTALHAVAREILRTLWKQGERQIPTQEAVEIMYEVIPTLPFALPFEALDELRWLVLGFCDYTWDPKRILALEEEIRVDVECPDGVTRVLKGQPDILLADPPDGLVVIDLKSGRGRPKGPRVEPEAGEVVEGREYLSSMFQGDTYSLLGLRRYPAAKRVTFRELHLRSGQIRQVTLSREALEHVERKLAVTMMLVDRAISEGEDSGLWKPRPGKHCARQCPVAVSCPIPREMRGDGSIESPEQADAAARAAAVLEGTRTALLESIKAWAEDPANPLPRVNEREVYAWNPPLGKGRRFKLWAESDLVTASSEGST
jgi:hypothetical protein